MIQTKTEIVFGGRDDKNGIIKIEVAPQRTTKEGTFYLVNDWSIIDGVQEMYKSKIVFYDNNKINQLDAYIEGNYSELLNGLDRTDREWKKMQIGLMIDTQTNLLSNGKTIYSLTPDDWEFSA